MCQPIYVKCENEDNDKCYHPQKNVLQPRGNSEKKVTMVMSAVKECPEYDPKAKTCNTKNPKNKEIIALALRFTVKCAHDQMTEAEANKASPLSELEKTLVLQKVATAVKGFEREQGMISMLQDMINGRRVEERENEFQLQRAAEADRGAGGAETVPEGRKKKGSKMLPAEVDDDESMGETSGPRRRGRKTDPATSSYGSAMSGAAGLGLNRKRDPSQELGSASRGTSQTRMNRTQSGFESDGKSELPSRGKKGTKEKDSGPSPAKKNRMDR